MIPANDMPKEYVYKNKCLGLKSVFFHCCSQTENKFNNKNVDW